MTSKEHPTATITTPNSTPGQSGRFGSERVAAFRRNQWPLSSECAVEQWSLTTLREKLVKIGAKIVRHGRYIVFQMAEVAIPRDLFADILRRIDRLRTTPLPT